MVGLGQSILEEGFEQGMDQGMKQGILHGIRVIVLDNIEDQIPRDKSIAKLQRRFSLTKEKAEQYYEMFASET